MELNFSNCNRWVSFTAASISFQFREQVVKETVERLEQKLYEKLVHHNQPPDFCESSVTAAPPPSESSRQRDWLMSCCNCQARIVGVRYQCRQSVLGAGSMHSLGGGVRSYPALRYLWVPNLQPAVHFRMSNVSHQQLMFSAVVTRFYLRKSKINTILRKS